MIALKLTASIREKIDLRRFWCYISSSSPMLHGGVPVLSDPPVGGVVVVVVGGGSDGDDINRRS